MTAHESMPKTQRQLSSRERLTRAHTNRPASMLGNKVQTKFAVDGKWVGVNRGNNYFFLVLEPGAHRFCSQAENSDFAGLVLEAGKVYFFQQHVEMGLLKARTSLERIDEGRGREALKKCHLSITEQK